MKKLLLAVFFLLIPFLVFAEEFSDLSPMESYKGNYFIFGDYKDQVKVQISFKYNLMKKYDTGVFLGYAQYMNWDLYKKSSPFKNIDYNPEVFIKSKYVFPKYIDFLQISPYEHISNGRDGNYNRSLNRCYVQAQWSYGAKLNCGINAKGYLYYNQASQNKDYASHTKYYEAKIFISFGDVTAEDSKDELYVKFAGWNKGYQEVGIISRKLPKVNPRLYLQLFHGYCSSLLDYSNSETVLRFGVIFK